jgi:LysM repeat protein
VVLPLSQRPSPPPGAGLRLVDSGASASRRSPGGHRVVGAVLAAIFVLSGVASACGRLLHHGPAPIPAVVEVQEGDTLWTLAQRHAPGSDPRLVVEGIRARNHLESTVIRPGQRLVVP